MAADAKENELRQAAAYESRIKDLMVLVDMNKKVAAEALKCSSTTAAKLEDITMYHHAQVGIWRSRMETSLRRRRQRRIQAAAFASLKSHLETIQTRRHLLTRLVLRCAWRELHAAMRQHKVRRTLHSRTEGLFRTWRDAFRSRRSVRRLWRPIARRVHARRLQHALMRWRLHMKDDQLQIWIECLKSANIALEEQAQAYHDAFVEQQATATREYAIEQRRYRRLDQTMEMCLTFRRWVGLCRLRHRSAEVADYRRRLVDGSLLRSAFVQWQQAHRCQRQHSRLVHFARQRRRRSFLSKVFLVLRRAAHQLRRLRWLCARRHRQSVALAWGRWQSFSGNRGTWAEWQEQLQAVEAERGLHLQRERDHRSILSSHMAALVVRCRAAAVRQRTFGQWRRCIRRRRQLRALRVANQRATQRRLQFALARWQLQTGLDRCTSRWLLHDRRTQGRRAFLQLWHRWASLAAGARLRKHQRFVSATVLIAWRRYVQTSCVQRDAARQLLKLLLRARCRRRWAQWHRWHVRGARFRAFRLAQQRRRMASFLRLWQRYTQRRRWLEKHAWRQWMAKREARREHKAKRRCFRQWQLRLDHQRRVERHVNRFKVHRYDHTTKHAVFVRWKQWARRRRAICRLLHRLVHGAGVRRPLRRALFRWQSLRLESSTHQVSVLTTRGLAQRFWKKCLDEAHRSLLAARFLALKAHWHRAQRLGATARWCAIARSRRLRVRVFIVWTAHWRQWLQRRQCLLRWLTSRQPRAELRLGWALWRRFTLGEIWRDLREGSVRVQSRLATLVHQQTVDHLARRLLRAWKRHAWLVRRQRRALVRVVHRRHVVHLQAAWRQLQMLRPITDAAHMERWLSLRWSREVRHDVLRRWRGKVRDRRRAKRLLLRTIVGGEMRVLRLGFVRWRRLSQQFQIRYQRYVFTSYIFVRLTRQASLRRLKLLWHHWVLYHVAHQKARAKHAAVSCSWRQRWLRRVITTWSHSVHQRLHRVRLLRFVVIKHLTRRLVTSFTRWQRQTALVRLNCSRRQGIAAASDVKYALAVARINCWRAKILRSHLGAWKAASPSRRARLTCVFVAWRQLWVCRRGELQTWALRTLSARFHVWRRRVDSRSFVRQSLLLLVRRWAYHRLRRGFSSWEHLRRRAIHLECLQRVMVIQAQLEAQERDANRAGVLRPLMQCWRRAVRTTKVLRQHQRRSHGRVLASTWRRWKSWSRQRRGARRMRHHSVAAVMRPSWQAWVQCVQWRRRLRGHLRRLAAAVELKRLLRVWGRWQHFVHTAGALQAQLLLQTEQAHRATHEGQHQARVLQYVQTACIAQATLLLHRTFTAWQAQWRRVRDHRLRQTRRQLLESFRTWRHRTRSAQQALLRRTWQRWFAGVCVVRQRRRFAQRLAQQRRNLRMGRLLRAAFAAWRNAAQTLAHALSTCVKRWRHRAEVALLRRIMAGWRSGVKGSVAADACLLQLVFQQWKQCHRMTRKWAAKRHVDARHAVILQHWIEHRRRTEEPAAVTLQRCLNAWRTDVFRGRVKLHWQPVALVSAAHALVDAVTSCNEAHAYFVGFHRWLAGAKAQTAKRETLLAKAAGLHGRYQIKSALSAWKRHQLAWRAARFTAQIWRMDHAKRGVLRCFHAWSTQVRASHRHQRSLLALICWVRSRTHRRHLLLLCLHVWRATLRSRTATADRGTDTPPPVTALWTLRRTYLRRRAKCALWTWFLWAHDRASAAPFLCADVGASVARQLVLHDADDDGTKQRQWLMHFFTQQSQANLLRKSFNGLKASRDAKKWPVEARLVLRQCVEIVATLQVRRRFQAWKDMYIALALQEAQEEHAVLMDALQDIAKYRHSLLP
ncbi:hypothetical protein ACHHYP_10455 [Achlya hypogyna]|uniref:Uncharacterized protein n=1 Tax=Achlya hypogyna TaxID=1202772 RepID=A0A1V9YLC9_ACHHY|nr:hypothetical protein ACHHYP_10455 [Achlya hypogyna]